MKTYTFKIKLQYPSEKHPAILSVIHCPLEILFDSLKEFKQLEELYKVVREPSNKEIPSLYLTASDYLSNNGIDYISTDFVLCEYQTILESKSLTDLLSHPAFYGFLDDNSSIIPLQIEYFKKIKKSKKSLKKAVKKDEV